MYQQQYYYHQQNENGLESQPPAFNNFQTNYLINSSAPSAPTSIPNYYMPIQFPSQGFVHSQYGAQINTMLPPPSNSSLQYFQYNNNIVPRPPPPVQPPTYSLAAPRPFSTPISHTSTYHTNTPKHTTAVNKYKKFHSSPPPTQININSKSLHYCEPCDKEFTTVSSFDAHNKTHEICRHPGCNFSASKKVIIAHFHGAHGLYSGSGFKTIDVEGQKFRVLLGTSPDEVSQWRADRKKKFPTTASANIKKEQLNELKDAGGVLPPDQKGNRKRNRPPENLMSNAKKPKANKARSHYEPNDTSISTQQTTEQPSNNLPNVSQSEAKEIKEEGKDDSDHANDNAAAAVASPKESTLSAADKKKLRCIHFSRGRCQNSDDSCAFSHDFTPIVCKYYIKFNCRKGNRCRHIHGGNKSKAKAANSDGSNDKPNNNNNDHKTIEEEENEKMSKEDCFESPVNQDQGNNTGKEGQDPDSSDSTHMNSNESEEKTEKEDNGKNGSSRPQQTKRKPAKEGGKSKLNIPPPLVGGERGTLLKKLLEKEIVAEDNMILQCLRFIVRNNFFRDSVEEALGNAGGDEVVPAETAEQVEDVPEQDEREELTPVDEAE